MATDAVDTYGNCWSVVGGRLQLLPAQEPATPIFAACDVLVPHIAFVVADDHGFIWAADRSGAVAFCNPRAIVDTETPDQRFCPCPIVQHESSSIMHTTGHPLTRCAAAAARSGKAAHTCGQQWSRLCCLAASCPVSFVPTVRHRIWDCPLLLQVATARAGPDCWVCAQERRWRSSRAGSRWGRALPTLPLPPPGTSTSLVN